MAAVTIATSPPPGIDASSALYSPQVPDVIAGENLDAPCMPCRIAAADGKVYRANGVANDANARFDGINGRGNVKAGQPVTIFGLGQRFRLSQGTLTPGQRLYVGAVAGGWADAPTTGGLVAIARAVSTTDAVVIVGAA